MELISQRQEPKKKSCKNILSSLGHLWDGFQLQGTPQEFSHLEFPGKMCSEGAGFKVPEFLKTVKQEKNNSATTKKPRLSNNVRTPLNTKP